MLSPEDLRAHKCELFATKESVDAALTYALSLVSDKSTMTVALMIYSNTLFEHLAAEAERNEWS